MFSKRPRLKTFDCIGRYRYFLTFCTKDRHHAFTSDANVSLTYGEIVTASDRCTFDITAYVFMPDHLHLLVSGRANDSDLKRFASLAKQRSAFSYARSANRPLWQPSYYDHALRPEESSLVVMHYILQNPVRAGLVEHWKDYRYLGSETMTIDEIVGALKEAGAAAW